MPVWPPTLEPFASVSAHSRVLGLQVCITVSQDHGLFVVAVREGGLMLCKCSASELFVSAIFFSPLIASHFVQCVLIISILFSSSQITPSFPTHITFVCPPPHRPVRTAQIFLDLCSPTGVWSPYLRLHSPRTQPLLSPCPLQLTTATCSTPPSMLGFRLVCACTGFGHAIAIPVRSYVQLPCLIQMLLPSCHFLCPCTFSAYTLVE